MFSLPTAGGGAGGSTSNHSRFRHLQGKYARMAEKQRAFVVMFHCKTLRIQDPGIYQYCHINS